MIDLSIIVPTYNAAQYLKIGLDSIFCGLNDDNRESIEVIVVDDGSTDDSLQIAKLYASHNSRVKVLHQKNQGVSAARNLGIKSALGKWLTFMDPDDAYVIGASSCLLSRLKNTQANILVFDHIKTDSQDTPCVCNQNGHIRYDMHRSEDVASVLKSIYPIAWNSCYQRILIGECRFELGIWACEDSLFGFTCLCKADVVEHFKATIYKYVQRPGSCMHNPTVNRVRSEIVAMSKLYQVASAMPWYEDFKGIIFRKIRVEVIGDSAALIPKFEIQDRRMLWKLFFSNLNDAFGKGYVPFLSRGIYRLAFWSQSPFVVKWGIAVPYAIAKFILSNEMASTLWRKIR